MDQILTLLGIDLPVDLRRQGLELLVVPERVILRAVLSVSPADAEFVIEEVRFAEDSSVEEDGFELPVPLLRDGLF